MVDQQNMNARYLDKFGSGTSSVRLHAPPGGKSSFSLGWGDDTTTTTKKVENKYSNSNTNNSKNLYNNFSNENTSNDTYGKESKTFKNVNKKTETSNSNNNNNVVTEKTSVRVKHAPGGASSIKFG